jgi:ATP synthase protein I
MDESRARVPEPEPEVTEAVGRKAARKLRARRTGRRGVWFGLGMFGLVGWAVALPTVAGVALGLWLDARFPSRVSWTLSLLFLGALLGSLNAWYWVKRESRDERGA